MKLTVFSDCHGNLENAIRILTESEADCYLFCGDGIRDAESAADLLDKRLIAVLGNCDRGETGETERLLELDGVRILLTHGHGYSVKSSLLPCAAGRWNWMSSWCSTGTPICRRCPRKKACCSAIPAAVWATGSMPRLNSRTAR